MSSNLAVQVADGQRFYYILADKDAAWSHVYNELSRMLNRPAECIRVARAAPGSPILEPDALIDDVGSNSSSSCTSVVLFSRSADSEAWAMSSDRVVIPAAAPLSALPKLPPSLLRYIYELKPNLPS